MEKNQQFFTPKFLKNFRRSAGLPPLRLRGPRAAPAAPAAFAAAAAAAAAAAGAAIAQGGRRAVLGRLGRTQLGIHKQHKT